PVRVTNAGSHVAVPEGPVRTVLRCRVENSMDCAPPVADAPGSPETALPDLLLPGRSLAAALPIPVPRSARVFALRIWAQQGHEPRADLPAAALQLIVEPTAARSSGGCCAPLLEQAEAALVEAQRLQRLPDNYTDVTLGWMARWKRWFKRKLL